MYRFALLILLFSTHVIAAPNCINWPEWQNFKKHFVTSAGRVVDIGSPQDITTSEGQSYGLFFALVANDQYAFNKLLNWTQIHLAEGDLSARLPAWKWGKKSNGRYGIIDSNPASDSDLWIAYALAEAGELWQERRYKVLASLMASRILREETVELAGLGLTLLPGPYGFEQAEQQVKLNASYSPLFLLKKMAVHYPNSPWQAVYDSSLKVLLEGAPAGFAPDWVLYQPKRGFYFNNTTTAVGNYNAIRVYLWAGMMAEDAPHRQELLSHYRPMANATVKQAAVPLDVSAKTGLYSGQGPAGFTASLLPFMNALKETQASNQLKKQLAEFKKGHFDDRYYDSVLMLFGSGHDQGYFTFNAEGTVVPYWKGHCQ